MNTDAAIVSLYVMVLVGMGLHGGRRVHSAADFTAAGGRYGAWALFASLSSSYIGGGYSAGNAAEAFRSGISMSVALCAFGIGTVLIGKYLVPGVARFPNATTAGGVLETAFGKSARVVSGFLSFGCCAGMVAAQMTGIGQVFHVLLGIPPTRGVLLGVAIVLTYSTFGGLQSVIIADIIQFVLLVIGLPVLLVAALRQAGGVAAVVEAVPATHFDITGGRNWFEFAALCLTLMLGEALAPPYMQRLLVGRSVRGTARATVASGWFSLPVFAVTGALGLCACALRVTEDPALTMPRLIGAVLPTGVRGLVMAAMVSIMLSAADGFLNSAAIGLVCDGVAPLCPRLSDKAQLRALRAVNLLTGLAAMALALTRDDVMGILLLAYTLGSPLLLVPLAAAFLGVRAGRGVFLASIGGGAIGAAVWMFVLGDPAGLGGTLMGVAGSAAAFAAAYGMERQKKTAHKGGRSNAENPGISVSDTGRRAAGTAKTRSSDPRLRLQSVRESRR
ncbi:MAG: sodium:solute symporter family protein [Clostridia bacterium]|nr:sodium:solute symporter family protein [Clostridia bacterium]